MKRAFALTGSHLPRRCSNARSSRWTLRFAKLAAAALVVALLLAGGVAVAEQRARPPDDAVKAVAAGRIAVQTSAGSGVVAADLSRDWSVAQPQITRVVFISHGIGRNEHSYWRTATEALAASGEAEHTMLILPQFLSDADVRAHGLPPEYLHWDSNDWSAGANANGPAPISTFEAIDAILARLADRSVFAHLETVVIAGHSAGAQLVQRYAVVGKGAAALSALGVHVRYVVANPSSYLYFDAARPVTQLRYCANFNRWKYGWLSAPPYAQALTPQAYEAKYAAEDVVYLLGTADIDPDGPELDKTCAAELQGANRYARGLAYFTYVQWRNPAMTTQRVVRVEGVAHDAGPMFRSDCGLSVLFDTPACPPTAPDSRASPPEHR